MTQTDVRAVPVEVLTDEELAVLGGPGGLVVTPFLVDLPDADREVALRTAYRGLLARGIVDPPTPQARIDAIGQPSVELLVRQDVRALVTLRAAATVVVAVARTTVALQDFWYAHVVDDVVLVEQVGADGMHRFALATAADLATLVVRAAIHPDCGDAWGEAVAVVPGGDPPLAVAERLGGALLRSDVVVRRSGDERPPLLGLFTGPGGAWVVEARAGAEQLVAVPSTRAQVDGLLREELARALAATR